MTTPADQLRALLITIGLDVLSQAAEGDTLVFTVHDPKHRSPATVYERVGKLARERELGVAVSYSDFEKRFSFTPKGER